MAVPGPLPFLDPALGTRVSYRSMVHQEREDHGLSPGSYSVHKLAQCLAEWLVVLQGVAEEREMDLPAVNCRCSKASKIDEELKLLSRKLRDAWQVIERVGHVQAIVLEEISSEIERIAGILRAEVSILVPSAIGRAELAVAEQARIFLSDGDMQDVVSEAVEGVARLVYDLLGVENCNHCRSPGNSQIAPMQEIDPEIMNMVAFMCGPGGDSNISADQNSNSKTISKDVGKEVLERSRKRKQNRPSRFVSPVPSTTNIMKSPIKKMRKVVLSDTSPPTSHTEILCLLEKKKKMVKKDGLYKFVLWREALKDEKTKIVT